MKICGLEKLSLVDYETKVACTVFTAGCNFACPFCQNSDLVTCHNLCEIDEKDFFDYLSQRGKILDGVCVSGGEPTLQPDLKQFVSKIKAKGLLVKLDTNGSNFEVVKDLVENKLVDFVAMDVKNSLDSYPKTVGKDALDVINVRKTAQFLMTCGVDYEFRTTLVAQLHTEGDMQKIAEWLDGAKVLYLQKFVDGGTCLTDGLSEVPRETAQIYRQILLKTIKNVQLRGY